MKSRLASTAFALTLLAPWAAWPQVAISINFGPPPLPVYAQPQIPADGYLWTPGYWAWNPSEGDYYWVPGTWVLAPTPGYLWTPGYWAYSGGGYRWNLGYWGPQVGFYGGINYGYGYTGSGYHGGRWDRGNFHYNQSVNNVNTSIVHNVYNTKVVNNVNVTRVSYNGGPKGVSARPDAEQRREREGKHLDPTPNQVQHERAALTEPQQRASVNHGKPPLAATPTPGAFKPADAPRQPDKARPVQPSRSEAQAVPPTRGGAEPRQAPQEVRKPPNAHANEAQPQPSSRGAPQAPPEAATDRPGHGGQKGATQPKPPPQQMPPQADGDRAAQPRVQGEPQGQKKAKTRDE